MFPFSILLLLYPSFAPSLLHNPRYATNTIAFHALINEYNACEGAPTIPTPPPPYSASDSYNQAFNGYNNTPVPQGFRSNNPRIPNAAHPRVCNDFLFGSCTRDPCNYLHPSLNDLPGLRHSPPLTPAAPSGPRYPIPANLPQPFTDASSRGRGAGRGRGGRGGGRNGTVNGGRLGNSGRGPTFLGKRPNPYGQPPSKRINFSNFAGAQEEPVEEDTEWVGQQEEYYEEEATDQDNVEEHDDFYYP